jgi:hypothetical protein
MYPPLVPDYIEFAPPARRTTDEWGNGGPNGEPPPPPLAGIDAVREIIRGMPHEDVEQLAREVLGRAPQYEVKKLAGRLRLWSLKT